MAKRTKTREKENRARTTQKTSPLSPLKVDHDGDGDDDDGADGDNDDNDDENAKWLRLKRKHSQ